jgi:hypothetical protein
VAITPAKGPERRFLKGLGFRPVGLGAGKEFPRLRFQPIVLFLKHGATEQLVDTFAGRSIALGLIDVLVEIRFDGKTLS